MDREKAYQIFKRNFFDDDNPIFTDKTTRKNVPIRTMESAFNFVYSQNPEMDEADIEKCSFHFKQIVEASYFYGQEEGIEIGRRNERYNLKKLLEDY
jgi:hypothetical protein